MNEQWKELKETIIELRDNDGTGTQQEVCKFLANLMDVLERDASLINDDTVSRQAAIDAIWDGINMDIYTREVKECLEALPSVTPQPRIGTWIKNEWGNISCSSCGCAALYDKVYPGESVFGKAIRVKSTFCPTCGAKMQEVEE